MNSYTHYYFAAQVERLFAPEQPDEYFWGAVAPDVRYLAGMPRAQTHRTRTELMGMHAGFPQCASFLRGYLVHCLLDEIDLPRLILGAFPLNLLGGRLRRRFSQHHAAVLVELYYMHAPHPRRPFGGGPNAVLDALCIPPDDSRAFSDGLRDYLAAPSIETGLATFQRLGFTRAGQGEKYTRAAQLLARQGLLRALLLWAVRSARLDRQIERHVQTALDELAGRGFVLSMPAGR